MFGRRNISSLSDEELLTRFVEAGDSAYFGELYNRYIPLIYGVCLKYLQNADDAQDAVMQLYENLSGKIGDYAVDTFRTWLYSVVKNHCLQILRKGNKEIVVDFTENIMESDIVLHLFSEEQSSEEQLQALDKCLEKLPEKQQISVRAFFLDEQSYADIAEQTGYSLKNIKSFIQNGKRNLKICIEKNTP